MYCNFNNKTLFFVRRTPLINFSLKIKCLKGYVKIIINGFLKLKLSIKSSNNKRKTVDIILIFYQLLLLSDILNV